ncbi:hypothetical protein GOV08_02085 [Candidatus Woesearchaeota archaeon]|nr:hypothetical protein [Candidatus Woesearchaeota archaeon]
MQGRSFTVRFLIDQKNNIQTQINSQQVAPTEAIGLLEMAKDQMMENLRKGRKNIFDVKGKP